MLPQEMNCGSGMSCSRRLRDWQEAGIRQLIHFALLDWLARYGKIDWSRAAVEVDPKPWGKLLCGSPVVQAGKGFFALLRMTD
jgi:hypothetical protein